MEFGVEWNFDNFIIITGVGRSGTTILGRILESLENTFVLYEPVLPKYLMRYPTLDKAFRAILMEDYFMPMVLPGERRKKKVLWLNGNNPRFILKTLESQFLIGRMRQIFPKAIIINAIRNGYDVIGSSVNRGWYTDDYLEHSLIDHVIRYRNCKIPWYMPERFRDLFIESDQVNRIALVWAVLVWEGMEHPECVPWSYEVMMKNPDELIHGLVNTLGAIWNPKLSDIASEIAIHPVPTYPKPTLTPEVSRIFNRVMTLAGYEI